MKSQRMRNRKNNNNKRERANNKEESTELQRKNKTGGMKSTYADKVKLGAVKAKLHLLFEEAGRKKGKGLGTDQQECKCPNNLTQVAFLTAGAKTWGRSGTPENWQNSSWAFSGTTTAMSAGLG